MKILKILISIIIICLGIFLFIFGGYDDSPGAQLLGVIVAASGLYNLIKTLKRK